MRLLVLKVCALAIALAVAALVIEASRRRARDLAEPAAAMPVASASAAATNLPPPPDAYGIIGPATKADPHAMRRAAESIERGVLGAPQAASSAPGKP